MFNIKLKYRKYVLVVITKTIEKIILKLTEYFWYILIINFS